VGHSVGGCVVVRMAHSLLLQEEGVEVVGVALVDIVETTSMSNLDTMSETLRNRPDVFEDVKEAVEWSVSCNFIRNLYSANLSIPSLLRKTSDGKYTWRTKLKQTEQWWPSWFLSLSSSFVSLPCPRFLLVSSYAAVGGDEIVNKAISEGEVKLRIIGSGAGHFMHEDNPQTIAGELVAYFFPSGEAGRTM